MEFKLAYLNAMRDQAPKMFNELRRTGALDAFVQEKGEEAMRLRADLLANEPKDPNGLAKNIAAQRLAEEIVFKQLIEFPPDDEPDDEPEIESLGEDGPLTAPPAY